MSEYTPTTREVRGAYRAWHDGQGDDHALKPTWSAQEFDRWLAAHDAEVRASVVTEDRWQYGAQNPDDPEGKIVAWSRGFTKSLVEHQGHLLFRRRPGSAPGPWEAIPDA